MATEAGSMIAAGLVTGLNLNLPDIVIAQVTSQAYDSATGQTIIVPQGDRLTGRYDSVGRNRPGLGVEINLLHVILSLSLVRAYFRMGD